MTMACTLDRSTLSNDGCSSIRATWVGIPPRKFTPWSATARSAASADQRRIKYVVPPPRRLPCSLVIGPRCAKDVEASPRGPPPQRSPTSMAVTVSNWRLKNSTPFGSPVVPDVNTSTTGRSGSSANNAGDAPAGAMPIIHESSVPSAIATSPPGTCPLKRTRPK